MAAPADITLKNLNGEWVMDKTLSNPTEPILELQGMGWLMRKALSVATVTLSIHEYPDPADPTVLHIDIDQTVTGGIKGTTEKRISDSEPREHQDHIFGHVRGHSKFSRGSKGEDGKVRPYLDFNTKSDEPLVFKFLRGQVLADGSESEGFLVEDIGEEYGEGEGLWYQSFVENLDSGWTAEQIWGFEEIGGKRYYTRRVAVVKGKTYKLARFVYTFIKPRAE
ncbi:uncharacterized protein BO80DRAFT_406802 [Aspergillus ibericus CBS 121593]|uniref:Uncharacterized protein n=1 Tax=Aspergillus ibericus CBS 121593 TaxID=1448316 RepID=A0A395GZR1_9EURO|nr:hypothetical protein BO80DRAFT_406802 [Aspergillus ibericus CBS 121593]RAL01081.1 hypothetical protein BO80DRAFT_406802 [Aspergillus ibericus CBS 121593]